MPPTPPVPASTPAQELQLLGQIIRRVERLSDASKRWLVERITADRMTPDPEEL